MDNANIKILKMGCCVEDSENVGNTIEVLATINASNVKVYFTVQLTSGQYEPQNGCWIFGADGEDLVFNAEEKAVFDHAGDQIISAAENAAEIYDLENYSYHDSGFNSSLNGWSLSLREDNDTGEIKLVSFKDSHNSERDFGAGEHTHHGSFSNLEAAKSFLEQFRTDDYWDLRGLDNFYTHDQL